MSKSLRLSVTKPMSPIVCDKQCGVGDSEGSAIERVHVVLSFRVSYFITAADSIRAIQKVAVAMATILSSIVVLGKHGEQVAWVYADAFALFNDFRETSFYCVRPFP